MQAENLQKRQLEGLLSRPVSGARGPRDIARPGAYLEAPPQRLDNHRSKLSVIFLQRRRIDCLVIRGHILNHLLRRIPDVLFRSVASSRILRQTAQIALLQAWVRAFSLHLSRAALHVLSESAR